MSTKRKDGRHFPLSIFSNRSQNRRILFSNVPLPIALAPPPFRRRSERDPIFEERYARIRTFDDSLFLFFSFSTSPSRVACVRRKRICSWDACFGLEAKTSTYPKVLDIKQITRYALKLRALCGRCEEEACLSRLPICQLLCNSTNLSTFLFSFLRRWISSWTKLKTKK